MIIRSLRLKNIKSYGEGPEGNGITIGFQPGVNRVAGRNGHGKTTLIEALGYALFFSQPDFEERFTLPTYFLRAGEKEGEIDVVFDHGGQAFRVERGLGQSKKRSKVVQLSDGSTCAMDDAEVESCLCRLLGFKNAGQMSDLFSNLIGVKQGRLTRPFDSRPAAAKEFFEPLLDVAIFRQCTSRLSDAQVRFKELLEEQNVKLATVDERIRERADSAEKVPIKEAQAQALEKMVEKSRMDKEQAEKRKRAFEQKEIAFNAAKGSLEEARNRLELASHKRETDQQRLNESQEAALVVKRTEPGYHAYVRAEEQLRILHQQHHQMSALQNQRAEALNARTKWEARKDGAHRQASGYLAQRDEQAKHADALGKQLADGSKTLQETQPAFDALSQATTAAKRSRDALGAWLQTLAEQVDDNQRLLDDVLQDWERIRGWDVEVVARARAEEQRLDEVTRDLARKLARSEELKETLARQLAEISGGICPFLKEKCRQFDPKAIQSDLSDREKEIQECSRKHKLAVETREVARRAWEKLAQEQAGLEQLKKSVQDKAAAFVVEHNKLLPSAMQNHFAVLQGYLPSHADMLRIQALTGAARESCWDKAKSALNTDLLKRLAGGQQEFLKIVSHALGQVENELEQRFGQFEKQRAERLRKEQDLDNARKNLERAEEEANGLSQKIEQLRQEAASAEAQGSAAATRVQELDEALSAFANLERDIREQNGLKEINAQDYKLYLGAKPLADTIQERQKALAAAAEREAQTREHLRQRTEGFELANRDFDLAALETARHDAAAAEIGLAGETQKLRDAQKELRQEKERFKQWKEACLERGRIEGEMGRLRAAGSLAKLAGKVLKDAAPAVAQHLCSRIAANAQRIFNQINQDPIELEWKAEPQYGLRVVPGDRRFAMLSGGEQTKLALAMTLAMIQEFSGLRFAVFDEPTYAVDADSRQKLADAILEAQKAAALEQLIVVSHDDAFEGKIENVVLLRKTAGSGTEPVALS